MPIFNSTSAKSAYRHFGYQHVILMPILPINRHIGKKNNIGTPLRLVTHCHAKTVGLIRLGSSRYLRQGAVQIRGDKSFCARKWRGGKILVEAFRGGSKISVHRDLKALLKHLEITLKNFRPHNYSSPYHCFCQCA